LDVACGIRGGVAKTGQNQDSLYGGGEKEGKRGDEVHLQVEREVRQQ
jgi:hypothetical protein